MPPSIRGHPSVNRRGGYDRDRFTYDGAHDRYICPQGHPLVRVHDNVPMQQQIYRASLADCRACPIRVECNPGAKASRIVSRSFEHELLEAVAEHLKTPRARDALRRRKQFVELAMADAKVRHGMHRAQRRGRENMFIQAVLTAATMNLLKLAQHSRKVGSGAAAMVNRPIECRIRPFIRVGSLLAESLSSLEAGRLSLLLNLLAEGRLNLFGDSLLLATQLIAARQCAIK